MASDISTDEQYLWVANRRLRSLIAFVLEVAAEAVNTAQEKDYVAKLKLWDETEQSLVADSIYTNASHP